MRYIYIDGYNVTAEINSIPAIDINIPEWGQMDKQIMNNTTTLKFPISYKPFFNNGRFINDITVKIYEDTNLIFNGLIDSIKYTNMEITVTAKNMTTVLFNNTLKQDYVIIDAYPSEILKQIAELSGLSVNPASYDIALNHHKTLDIKFTVIDADVNYAEVLQKLAEVTCGKIYMLNDELYYEVYDANVEYAVFELDDSDWVTYPAIEQQSVISTVFNGIDVKFGNGLLLYGINGATKVIDMSNNSIIRTSNMIRAKNIANAYQSLGNAKKYKLSGSLKESLKNILYRFTRISYNDRIYNLINIDHQSDNDIQIIAESLD
jgi:hypothetical protein